MSFDPEKAERLELEFSAPNYSTELGVFVSSEDYDQLLSLYRDECAKTKAFADGLKKASATRSRLSPLQTPRPPA